MQKQQIEKFYDQKIKIPMFSTAGRVFQKQLMIDDIYCVKKNFRKNMKSDDTKSLASKKNDTGFYSPFKTISREARDSYLLRVTYQPNVKTNYQLNHNKLLSQSPKYTINKGSFVRRIHHNYQTRDKTLQQPSKDLQSIQPKCKKSLQQNTISRPLTVSDCMNYRKTFHHLDFNKQTSFRNYNQDSSTKYHTFEPNTTQSHFNNLQRFSSKPKPQKAHDFDSDDTHNYLNLEKQQKIPIFDLQKTNWNRIKRRWDGNKANLKFYTFRNNIKVRQDRSQQAWTPKIDYTPKFDLVQNQISKTIEFFKDKKRVQNTLPNKNPIKLSQRMDYNERKYSELNEQLKQRLNNTISI